MPRLGGSLRDPAGFVFTAGGTLYRPVNRVFADEFEACTRAGLYDALEIGGRRHAKSALVSLVGSPRNAVASLSWRPADIVMAQALVHHLVLSDNVPLDDVAAFFARLGRTLIVEFVGKSDTQVQRLLRNRPDIFPDYTTHGFERAFGEFFVIADCQRVGDAERWLYLMTRREPPSA